LISIIPLSLLGWRVVSGQDPPENCIDPLGIFMDAQTSESVLKEMGNSEWSEMFLHQINPQKAKQFDDLFLFLFSCTPSPSYL